MATRTRTRWTHHAGDVAVGQDRRVRVHRRGLHEPTKPRVTPAQCTGSRCNRPRVAPDAATVCAGQTIFGALTTGSRRNHTIAEPKSRHVDTTGSGYRKTNGIRRTRQHSGPPPTASRTGAPYGTPGAVAASVTGSLTGQRSPAPSSSPATAAGGPRWRSRRGRPRPACGGGAFPTADGKPDKPAPGLYCRIPPPTRLETTP